jgi:protein-disulfide isomerase
LYDCKWAFFQARYASCIASKRQTSLGGIQQMKKLVLTMIVLLIAASAFADEKRFSVPLNDSPTTGPADAPVTIVEFIDFQ